MLLCLPAPILDSNAPPLIQAGQSHSKRDLVDGFLRDARLWRAPQDEVSFCGVFERVDAGSRGVHASKQESRASVLIQSEPIMLNPHGEERRSRRVSNHEGRALSGKARSAAWAYSGRSFAS